MANSISISDFKLKIVDAIAHDDTLFYAFDAKGCENGGDLINTHIFKYNKNPETITEAITFMTIMVHTRTNSNRNRDYAFIIPTLEIWIYSHNDHMKMDSKITKDNRNDYISMLLDTKFNGSTEYGGIGKLMLTLNQEGTFNQKFLYRRMIFETIDVNASFCEMG